MASQYLTARESVNHAAKKCEIDLFNVFSVSEVQAGKDRSEQISDKYDKIKNRKSSINGIIKQ